MRGASLGQQSAALFANGHDAERKHGQPALCRSARSHILQRDVQQIAGSRGHARGRIARGFAQIPADCEAIAGLKVVAGDVWSVAQRLMQIVKIFRP